nr:hypothetical protein [uncultured Collinsella sp.]
MLVYYEVIVDNVPAIQPLPACQASLGVLVDPILDALAVHRAFPFGKHLEHAELQYAAGSRRDVLAGIQDLDPAPAEDDTSVGHLITIAHDARHFVNDNEIELAERGIRHHALELLTIGVASRLRVVAVLLYDLQALTFTKGSGVVHLDFDTLAALVVRREARIDRRAILLHGKIPFV